MTAVNSSTPVLVAENLKVRYRNGALGIVDVSFTVNAGSVVALFGPNGAGKTTTVRAVSGFVKTEGARLLAGTVTIFGKPLTGAEPHRVHHAGVATVPERNKVFASMSVAENLTAIGGLPPRRERSASYDRIHAIFPDLAEKRNQLAGRLSGGQQQMLAIARALMTNPRLLIIDEMTLGLHHSLHAPLFGAVRDIAKAGTAVVLVDESTGIALEIADYCYLLHAGAVASEGPSAKFHGSELLAAGYVE